MESHLKTERVLTALNMALAQRRPEAVVHHSDRGCQYTSYAFGKRCCEAGVMPSMGSTGDAYDNAMAESFFATLEREVLNRRRFQSHAEARMTIFQWLEGWYNPHRRHSALHPSTTRGDSCRRVLETQARTRPRKRVSTSCHPWGGQPHSSSPPVVNPETPSGHPRRPGPGTGRHGRSVTRCGCLHRRRQVRRGSSRWPGGTGPPEPSDPVRCSPFSMEPRRDRANAI